MTEILFGTEDHNGIGRTFFSSLKQTWKTPKLLYKKLNDEFHFDFDPCPTNAKFDGLGISWKCRSFINTPHRTQKLWVKKAYLESTKSIQKVKGFPYRRKICVMLLPARPDTKIFHEVIIPFAYEVRFINVRLKYDEHKNSALFPSMIVVFDQQKRLLPYLSEVKFSTYEFR